MSTAEKLGESVAGTDIVVTPRPRMRFGAKVLTLLISSVITFLVGEAAVRLGIRPTNLAFETDEELMWRNRPNQVVLLGGNREDQTPRSMTTDERGFRRTLPPVPPGARRVLAVGDSATFGSLVDDEQTFCSQLQALAGGKLDVINSGVPGWGLFQEQALLNRIIGTIRPSIVLVHHQVFDVLRQPFPPGRRESFLWESRVKNAIREYSRLGALIGHLAQLVVLGSTHRGSPNSVLQDGDDSQDGPSVAYRNCWKADRERLIAMKNMADRHGAKLVVVYEPFAGRNCAFFITEMDTLARELGIVQVNMAERISHHAFDALRIPGDGHPAPLWHRLVAEEVYKALGGAGLLDGEGRGTSMPAASVN